MKENERIENDILDIWSPIWDVEKTVDSLNAEVEAYNEVLIGWGYKLRLNRAKEQLELYPEQHVACLLSPYFRFNIAHVSEVRPLVNKVRIHAADVETDTTVVMDANGSIFLNCSGRSQSLTGAELPREAATFVAKSEPKQEMPPQEGRKEKAYRFTGRIGEIVEARTTTGKLRAVVPLGVKCGEDTIWHRIVFGEDKAEQILKARKAGEFVTVVFYEYAPREVVTKTGIRKLVPDLRGAAIYTPKENK